MVKLTNTGEVVELDKVLAIFPVPLAASPVTGAVLSLVQVKPAKPILLVVTIVVMDVPLQMLCTAGVETAFTEGFTVMVIVIAVPVQVTVAGVTVKCINWGTVVLLMSIPAIFPVPLAPIDPVTTGLSLTQLNDVPVTIPVKLTGVMVAPEQTDWLFNEADTVGIAFTVSGALAEITFGQIPPNPSTITL